MARLTLCALAAACALYPVAAAPPAQAATTQTLDDTTPPAPKITSPLDGSVTRTSRRLGASGTAGTAPGDSSTLWLSTPADEFEVDGSGGVWSGESDVVHVDDCVCHFTITQTDAAGNVGSHTISIRIDQTPPAPTLTAPLTPTNDATPTFSGIRGTAVGDLAEVKLALLSGGPSSSRELTTTLTGDAWSATPATPLADGRWVAFPRQFDDAGNESANWENPHEFVVDTVAPAVELTMPQRTNDPTPTIAGVAGDVQGFTSATDAPAVKLTVTRGEELIASFDVQRSGGAFSTPLPVALVQEGAYTVTADQTDSAGNSGRSTHALVYDTTAPAVALTSPPDQARTNALRPAIGGSAGTAAGDANTVDVTLAPAAGPSVSFQAAVGPDGAWSGQPASDLAEGAYTITARQADVAGNATVTSPRTVHVDRTGPAVTIAPPSRSTRASAPELSGTTGTAAGDEPAVIVELRSPGEAARTVEASVDEGTWRAAAPDLPEGEWTAHAAQSDAAGNTGQTPSVTIEVDRTPPAILVVAPADGATTSDTTPTVSGIGSALASDLPEVTVRIYAGTSDAGAPLHTLPIAAPGGPWSVDVPAPLAPGTYTARAEQADAAGNTGRSRPHAFTVADPAATPPPPPGTGLPAVRLALRLDPRSTLRQRLLRRRSLVARLESAGLERASVRLLERRGGRLAAVGRSATRRLTGADTIAVRVSRAAVRRLRRPRVVRLVVRVVAVDAAGAETVLDRRLTLRR